MNKLETPCELQVYWGEKNGVSEQYTFYCYKLMNAGKLKDKDKGKTVSFKQVCYGYFVDRAPEGVEPGVYCFLLRIHALPNGYVYRKPAAGTAHSNEDALCRFPQFRERYETLDLDKPHIRRILASNAGAEKVRNSLEKTFDCEDTKDCCVVVPPYKTLPEYGDKDIQRCEELTPWERLEYIYQACLALLDLYSFELCGRKVIAYRDAKFSNFLIESEEERFAVRLTDLATIRFADEPDVKEGVDLNAYNGSEEGADPDGTVPFLMSRENTAPEILMEDLEVSSKVDVYALGNMLANLFGYSPREELTRNPNAIFCLRSGWPEKEKPKKNEIQETLLRAFRSWEQRDENSEPQDGSWLERAVRDFRWGDHPDSPYPPSEALLQGIRELFFHATRIDPEKRIDLEGFKNRIRELKKLCDPSCRRSRSPLLYKVPMPVYLIHQKNVAGKRDVLQAAVRDAMKKDGVEELYLEWYINSGDARPGGQPKEIDAVRPSEAEDQIKTRLDDPVQSHTLTEAMRNAKNYFKENAYEIGFNGIVRVFTFDRITEKTLPDLKEASLLNVFGELERLAGKNQKELQVCLHCTVAPSVPEEIRDYVRAKKLGGAASARKERPPVREEKPVVRMELYYKLGQEGLFFDADGRKIFVSRKKGG